MRLSEQQVARFQGDGYLIFPELFSKAEIAALEGKMVDWNSGKVLIWVSATRLP